MSHSQDPNQARSNRHSPALFSKQTDLSKQNKAIKTVRNLSIGGAKGRRLSISVTPLPIAEQPKLSNRHKGPPLICENITGKHIDAKLDINFTLNPYSIMGSIKNNDFSDYFFKNAQQEAASNNSSVILPKLLSNGGEAPYVSKRKKKHAGSTAHLERMGSLGASINNRLLLQKNSSQKVLDACEEKGSSNWNEGQRDGDSNQRRRGSPLNVLGDIVKEEGYLDMKISALKAQTGSMKLKIMSLEKENMELRGQVKMYKDMLGKMKLAKNQRNELDSPNKDKTTIYDSDGSKSARGYASAANRLPLPKPADPALHERLNNIFKTFSKYKSMYYTMETAVAEACKAFDCGYARILLTNEQAKKGVKVDREKLKTRKIFLGGSEVFNVEQKDEELTDCNVFSIIKNIEELKKPICNDKRGISHPIFSANNPAEFWGAIQICEPMITSKHEKAKRKKGFVVKDELLLSVYAKVMSLIIDSHLYEWLAKEQEKKLAKYHDSMVQIVNTRDLQEVLEIFKLRLAEHFNFEGVGLLFYEPKEESMFTFSVQRKPDGRFYTKDPIVYAAKHGVSGKCLRQNLDIMLLPEPLQNQAYLPDIDNTTGISFAKNIVIALLKDEKGKKVGVLQLVNKLNNQTLDEKDEVMVRSAQKLLGSLIAHINEINTVVNLSYRMGETMKNIEATLNPAQGNR